MDSNWVKSAQGKMIDPAMRPYFDPAKLPEIYQKHYPAIVVMSGGQSESNILRNKVANELGELTDEKLEALLAILKSLNK